jgi:hypothetical protein
LPGVSTFMRGHFMKAGVDTKDDQIWGIPAVGKIEQELLCHGPYKCRMRSLLRCRCEMRHAEWLQLLGRYWSRCHNNNRYKEQLIVLLGRVGPVRQMMDDHESSFWDNLPDVVEIYRGCDARYHNGISWSPFGKTASRFPMRRKPYGEYVLVRAHVKKANVLAVKLDVDGHEIITFDAVVCGVVSNGDASRGKQ